MLPIPPDPDFRFADSDIAPTTAARNTLSAAADAIRSMVPALAATNIGHGADLAVDQMLTLVEQLNDAAGTLWASEKLHTACAAARDHFRAATSDAAVSDVEAAFAAWQALSEQLKVADNHHAALVRPRLRAAQVHYFDLQKRREDAVRDYEAAEDSAVAAFQSELEKLRMTHGRERAGHVGAPAPAPSETPVAPAPSTPGAAVTLPGGNTPSPAELPVAATPLAAPPDTSLAAVPGTGGGLTPAQAAVLGAALSQQQQGQQQPVQIPAPTAAPPPTLSPPQPQRKPEDPFANADTYDPNEVLAAISRGDFRPSSATVAAPAITPVATPEPTFTPLGLTGAPAANPVVSQPITTGTSLTGLETTSNVSGRPDGAAARTATSPATNLSGAIADQASGRAPAAGVGTGMGGVPPMMGPMMGGMNGMGGAGKDREPVTATMTPDQVRLLGLEAVGEAVPGGTIARKDVA